MGNKLPPIPKIDLSAYIDTKNIPLSIEKIIAEGLIAFNCDIDKVVEHFSINPEMVNTVYIKYYSTLSAIYQTNLSTKNLDSSLNDSCDIFNKHIKEIKKAQNKSNSKTLKASELNNLCRMVDRITSVRDQATKSYDTTINKLNNNINALKVSEARISGPLEDDSAYLENQSTVAKMLEQYNPKEKKITIVNIKTNEMKVFNRPVDAERYIGTVGHLRDIARQKKPYRGEYMVYIEE